MALQLKDTSYTNKKTGSKWAVIESFEDGATVFVVVDSKGEQYRLRGVQVPQDVYDLQGESVGIRGKLYRETVKTHTLWFFKPFKTKGQQS